MEQSRVGDEVMWFGGEEEGYLYGTGVKGTGPDWDVS